MYTFIEKKKWIKSFARRSKLEPNTEKVLEMCSLKNSKESIEKIVNSHNRIQIEVGFGRGENILYQALNEPDILFIGCEPYLRGVCNLLVNIKKYNIKNILIWIEDARELIANFPNKRIEFFFILFPDPWPKRKHHKRRLINKEFLNLLAKKMIDTGEIFIATDHQCYSEWINLHVKECDFLIYAENDYCNLPITKYHQRALKLQHKIRFFKLSKNR